MLGESPEEQSGPPALWLDRVHLEDHGTLQAALQAHLRGVSPHFECEHRVRSSDGGYVWVLVRGMAVRDAGGRPSRIAGSQTDITARRAAEEQLRLDAIHDPLTGLYNRRQLLLELDRELASARRHGYPLSFGFCDVDHFKQVNDAHGHPSGDRVLRTVAEALRRHLRVGDIAGRYGGDEFCVIFPHTQASRAVLVTERIRRSLEATTFSRPEGQHFRVSATFGVADLAEGQTDAATLIEHADSALYKAKKLGRNCSYPPPQG
jgi:diguanylate cyclase (GGDEF)-like protein/PAS domain S-box-containing protein